MPELPEVESQAKDLIKSVINRPIKEVWIGWQKSIKTPKAEQFAKQLIGRRIKKITRRGKFILMQLDKSLTLITHFRMTGHFRLAHLSESKSSKEWYILPKDRFTRVAFRLDKNEILHWSDIRKFGRLWLIPSNKIDSLPELEELGPEPLTKNFKKQDFISCLRDFKGMIKPVLLNQKCVAGIGNIYADESLFDAQIHPKSRVQKLDDSELIKLYKAVRKNLTAGVKHGGSSIGEYISIKGQRGGHAQYLKVYQQIGKHCHAKHAGKKCSGIVKRIVVAQRGTHICPECQSIKK